MIELLRLKTSTRRDFALRASGGDVFATLTIKPRHPGQRRWRQDRAVLVTEFGYSHWTSLEEAVRWFIEVVGENPEHLLALAVERGWEEPIIESARGWWTVYAAINANSSMLTAKRGVNAKLQEDDPMEIKSYTGQDFYIIVELNDYDNRVRTSRGMYETEDEARKAMAEMEPGEDAHLAVWSKAQYQSA